MADRSVRVRLSAEVAGYVQGMRQAAQATKSVTAEAGQISGKQKQALQDVGKVGVVAGTAVVGALGFAVKTAADFQAAMSKVQAATQASATEMGDLRAAAIDAGAQTVFSASEAADAILQLGKAGVSTGDILGGGLDGALALAAAGSLDVGQAAEIAASALTQFKLSGDRVPHVADLLAAAAGNAQGEVSDMGQALAQVGLVASQSGLSIEETTGGLAAFASAGLLGSDAGTSFKSMLQRLNPQSAEAADLMDQLGFSAYDSQGNFIGLAGVADELQTSLAGMSVEQRNAALQTLFGSDAIRAAAVLYDQGADGINAWTTKVNEQGYATKYAETANRNLNGSFEALQGSIQTALITAGDPLLDFLDTATQKATGAANAFTEAFSSLPPSLQTGTTALVGMAGGAAFLGGAMLATLPRIVETRAALAEMPRVAAAARASMIGLGGAAAYVGVAFAGLTILDVVDSKLAGGVHDRKLADDLLRYAQDGKTSGELLKAAGKDFDDFGETLHRAADSKWAERLPFFPDFYDLDSKSIDRAKRDVEGLDQALAQLATNGHADTAASAFDKLKRDALAAGYTEDDLADRLPRYTAAADAAATATEATSSAQRDMSRDVGAATLVIDGQTTSLTEQLKATRALSNQVLALSDAQIGYQAAVDDATASAKEHGKTLNIDTEAGRANQSALNKVADAANQVLEQMAANGALAPKVTAEFAAQRDQLVKTAQGFGMTKQQAEAYADSVLRIPPAVTTNAVFNTASAVAAARDLENALNQIPGFKHVQVIYDQSYGTRVASPRGGFIPERASGGPVGAGLALVGENGPELVRFARAGQVMDASTTRQLLQQAAGGAGSRFAGVRQGFPAGSSAAAPVVVPGSPTSLTVVDADGRLIGTMRVVAQAVVGEDDRADARLVRAG